MKDRKEKKVFSETVSIWTYILSKKKKFTNPFFDQINTNYTIYPDLRNSSVILWNGYWLRDTNFKILQERGLLLINEISSKTIQKDEKEKLNQETVNIFQSELKNIIDENNKLKIENNDWQERWKNDTNSLLELCEKQKIELNKWSKGIFIFY
jgi:FtsZ-binding cell division protein ZapB